MRYLKEMLYSIVGKRDNGDDIYLFETIYDYQSIIELKIWNNIGNFDRVSEMLLRGIQWKAKNYAAAKLLEKRREVIEEESNNSKNIMKRAWF